MAASCATPAIRSSAGSTPRAKRTSVRCGRRSPSRTSRSGPTRAHAVDHRHPRAESAGRRGRAERRDRSRRDTARHRVVRCGQLRCAAAAIEERRASERPGQFIGTGRTPLHGAPRDHDAGFHPFRLNSTRFQKTVAINDFYLPGPHSRYPLGQIQSQGRTHGVMAQTVYPRVPLGAYEWWVSRGVDWLVMSRICRGSTTGHAGRRRADPSALPAEQLQVAPDPRRKDKANPAPARVLGRGQALARQPEHDAPVRHAGVRDEPARLGARSFCRSHDIDNLFVVDSFFRRLRPSIPG